MQPSNIELKLLTESVVNLVISIDFKLLQSLNKQLISVTNDVSIVSNSIDSNWLHPLNILLIFVTADDKCTSILFICFVLLSLSASKKLVKSRLQFLKWISISVFEGNVTILPSNMQLSYRIKFISLLKISPLLFLFLKPPLYSTFSNNCIKI